LNKLSEILQVRERLVELINYHDHEYAFDLYAGHIKLLFGTTPMLTQSYVSLVSQNLNQSKMALANIKESLTQEVEKIDNIRRELEHHYYTESEKLYVGHLNAIDINGPTEVFNNVLKFSPDDQNLIQSRLGLYTDWRLPGLLLRPGQEDFIDTLVALDPLFIADIHDLALEPALQRYNEIYQRRLRKYIITDHHEDPLSELPQNQFGLCFASSFFNLKTVQVIDKYFRSIFAVLRPGGIFAFTFCNGDKFRAVSMCENMYYCYTPGQTLQHHWEEIGFELQFKHESSAEWTYCELRKPGMIESNRGGQSLAQILPFES
jgi:hypothetical protein